MQGGRSGKGKGLEKRGWGRMKREGNCGRWDNEKDGNR